MRRKVLSDKFSLRTAVNIDTCDKLGGHLILIRFD